MKFLNGFLKEGIRLFHISVVWTIVAYIYVYVDYSYVKMFLWREHCYYLHFFQHLHGIRVDYCSRKWHCYFNLSVAM
jgi:hypothetical protein